MPKLQLRAVDTERPHSRDVARQRVKAWRSDADREALPVTNIIDTGAPLLKVDDVVRASYPNHAERKA